MESWVIGYQKRIPAPNRTQRQRKDWELKLRDWLWYSEFKDGKISLLTACDDKRDRFKWGLGKGIVEYNSQVRDSVQSIAVIKKAIADNDYYKAGEAWFELSEDEQKALWRSPTSGGVFTTKERDIMTNKLRAAYYGEKD